MGRQRRRPAGLGGAHPGRLLSTLLVVAATASTLIALMAAAAVPLLALSPGDGVPPPLSTAGLAVALTAVAACWLTLSLPGNAALGMSVVTLGWMLPALAAVPAIDPQLARGMLSAGCFTAFGAALAARRDDDARRTRAPLGLSLALAVGAAGLLVLGYDPLRDPVCIASCPQLDAPLADALGPRNAWGLSMLAVLGSAAAAVAVVWRCRTAAPSVRAASAVTVAGAATAVMVPWLRWGALAPTAVDDALVGLGLAALSLSLLAAAVRLRRTRGAVLDLVQQLERPTAPASGSQTVAAVHFSVPDEGRWVTELGQPAEDVDASCLVITHEGAPSARLVLSRGAAPDDVEHALGPASRLALVNAWLRTLGSVRLADVQASQRRIVASADTERARIERDLHDATQQLLVATEMHLQLAAAATDAGTAGGLRRAGADVHAALDALRRVAHGSYAGVLENQGLGAAIEDVVDDAPASVSVELELTDEDLLDPPAKMAVLTTVAAVVAAVAEAAPGGAAAIRVGQEPARLAVTAEVDGAPVALDERLVHASDRVGAAGGSWRLAQDARGVRIEVSLPCES